MFYWAWPAAPNFCKVNLEGLPRSCLTRKIPSLLHGMFCCFVSLFSSYKSFCEHLDLRFLLMFSVCVWLMLGPTLLENEIKVFSFSFFFFFFFLIECVSAFRGTMHCSCTIHRTHNHFIQKKKNIKNGSYSTIHIFKNYFATVFSVFSKISCIQTNHLFQLKKWKKPKPEKLYAFNKREILVE